MEEQPQQVNLTLPDFGLDELYRLIGKLVVEKEQHVKLIEQLVAQQKSD